MKKFLKKIKYKIEYFIFILAIKLLKLLGIDNAANICGFLARYIGPIFSVTNTAKKNLHLVFGVNINQRLMINKLWDNFGRFIGEFPYIHDMDEFELNKRVKIEGLHHLEEFNCVKQPFILFSGHFANWDLAIRVITKFYNKFGIVYRKANNPYVNEIINNLRKGKDIYLIPKGFKGSKDLLKAIKSRFSIAILPDQKMNEGISVPFFSHPAMTPVSIARLALNFNYPIVPCQIIRNKGSYFTVVISSSLSIYRTGDNKKDCYNIMLKINQILERWVLDNPEQWFWFHNRWN